MTKNVYLDDEEWQKVLSIIAQAPWNVANPLLMKIGEQLRGQDHAAPQRVGQGNGELQHKGDDPSGPPAAPGGRGGVVDRAEKSPRKT